jgi:hypothetical protein
VTIQIDSTRDGIGGNKPPAGFKRVCAECGDAFESLKTFGGFCCPAHRAQFNARRAQRGAELYDLIMAWRYERNLAGLWQLVCKMAATFRDEDFRDRAGRRSWRNPRTVVAERPWLFSSVVVRRKAAKASVNACGEG